MGSPISTFQVGSLYSSEDIQTALGVGNAGGVRLALDDSGRVRRMVVMTSEPSARQARENPYHDRIESSVLVYTGAGREGDQTLGGVNQRIPQQATGLFPVYGFIVIGSRRDKTIGPKRWRFLGLLQYIRHYPENQIDVRLQHRRVWLFEFRIHSQPAAVPIADDAELSAHVIAQALMQEPDLANDRELAETPATLLGSADIDPAAVESVRGQLLGMPPERFEHTVKETLIRAGFERVTVTRLSQDGGIDVNAFASCNLWPVKGMLVQAQAKRWLHTVGRREVAELRGSLQPHARGLVVTTSHYSRAAITEAGAPGKLPIALVDGFQFASLVRAYDITI